MRGSLVRFQDNEKFCWSRVDAPSGEPIYISVARNGVLIKNSNLGLLGRKLFSETDVDVIVQISMNIELFLIHDLRRIHIEADNPVQEYEAVLRQNLPIADLFRSPILRAFTALALDVSSLNPLEYFLAMPELRWSSEDWLNHLEAKGW